MQVCPPYQSGGVLQVCLPYEPGGVMQVFPPYEQGGVMQVCSPYEPGSVMQICLPYEPGGVMQICLSYEPCAVLQVCLPYEQKMEYNTDVSFKILLLIDTAKAKLSINPKIYILDSIFVPSLTSTIKCLNKNESFLLTWSLKCL